MTNKKEKGLMAMPAVVLFTFTFAIVAIAIALVTANNVVLTKTYILNETRADMTLYNFLIDNTCSKTKITNAELLSIGIMQQKKVNEEIEINYGGIEEIKIFEDCIITFFDKIEYKKDYYFSATDKITTMTIGDATLEGTTTITYIPSLDDTQIKITLVREYD